MKDTSVFFPRNTYASLLTKISGDISTIHVFEDTNLCPPKKQSKTRRTETVEKEWSFE